ncbi:MAG: hypothetical protein GWP16_00500 [Nitrospirae bacterium]|nr:hypothetical protein [Nitrospirota bacterium]
MSAGFEFTLIPLDCPTCGAGIHARGEDLVYYCTACRNGYLLDPADWSLRLIETAFVAAAHIQAEEYRPFWLLPARISISQRQASGGGFTGILQSFFGEDRAFDEGGEGVFAVPAFQAPLASVTRLVRSYTEGLPGLKEKLGERLLGGCYGRQDAEKLAHYALIATEVEKPDKLLNLKYDIDFGEPRLLGVPFYKKADATLDAIFNIEV